MAIPVIRIPRSVVPVSAGFVTLALVWWAVAVPVLVKYPTNLDVTPRYRGGFTLFVDPTTTAPLATPRQAPLEIDRHVRSLSDESGSSRIVVEETIRQRAAKDFHMCETEQLLPSTVHCFCE